jgi:hypothetical protein
MIRNILENVLGFAIALALCLMFAYSVMFDSLPDCLTI